MRDCDRYENITSTDVLGLKFIYLLYPKVPQRSLLEQIYSNFINTEIKFLMPLYIFASYV